MAHLALTTISSKEQHALRVKAPFPFPGYTSGCPHSFLPCRVAFLSTEGSSAWWQRGDPPGQARTKIATELERGDHGAIQGTGF